MYLFQSQLVVLIGALLSFAPALTSAFVISSSSPSSSLSVIPSTVAKSFAFRPSSNHKPNLVVLNAEGCPCGSGGSYEECSCGRLHADPNAYEYATCEEIVRARYTAYAKADIDFITESTHPEYFAHLSDKAAWTAQIQHVIDTMKMTSCKVTKEEEGQGGQKKVQFIITIQNPVGENAAFMETATFETGISKEGTRKGWLYKSGDVEELVQY